MSADLYAFRRNVVLVASAGTGKTHALVGVLLHALLGTSELGREPIPPSRVAATTFSRKAAAEIRERLVTELERLAFDSRESGSPYVVDLDEAAQRRGLRWSSALRVERARRALADIDAASIGTLHALAYATVRSHALAVGLAPSLGVASEEDTEAWTSEAVLRALEEHAAERPDDVRDLFRLLRGRDRAHDELVRLLLMLDEDGRSASSLVLPEGDAAWLEATVREVAGGVPDAPQLANVLTDAFADDKALRERWPGTSHRDRATSLAGAWGARGRILATAAVIRSVLGRAQAVLVDLHTRAGAIGFGSALRLSRDALRDNPLAAARASEAYDALLVDEFQDTSRLQVELVRLLWERSPRDRTPGAMPLPGDVRPRGLLIVGDRKQSIYAFRGADVGSFVATCIELAGEPAQQALGIAPGIVPLPARPTADFFVLRENHRASAAIIDFVNAFSRDALRAESDELFEARYVEETESLVAVSRPVPVEPSRITWLRPAGAERNTTRVEEATLVATYVGDAAFREKNDAGRILTFADFAVLAQSTEMLDATAFVMARQGIPHVVAGRGFFAAREVQDLLWLLRWIERPDDRVALLSVLRGPCAALSDRTLLALTEPHRGLVTALERWDELERRTLVDEDDREALDRARTVLRALSRSAERIGPGRTLRVAVRTFEIEPMLLLLPRGVQRVANVRKLLRMADGEPTVRSLLERVARAEARAREPEAATFAEDDDAVRLLTIHASKGLAFPVVIIPELRGSPVRSASNTFGIDLRARDAWLATKVLDDRGEPVMTPSFRQLVLAERARLRADRRRLMYVAVTRAKERLVFVGGIKASAPQRDPNFGAIVSGLAASGAIDVREPALEPRSVPPRARDRDIPLAPSARSRTTEITIAPTALQDFDHCPRRFDLVHVLRAPEPTPRALGRFRADGGAEANARAEGNALHAVLERVDVRAFGAADAQDAVRASVVSCDHGLDDAATNRVIAAAVRFLTSPYAARVAAGAEIEREHAFVSTIESSEMTVTLRGAMDLVVRWPNGDVDVVDYKSARGPDERPHGLQLDVYAWAMAREGAMGRVRAGAMFLGAETPEEPRFRARVPSAKLEARLVDLATRLVASREQRRFPRAAPKTCHAIGCGYFTLCHPAREGRQLALFR